MLTFLIICSCLAQSDSSSPLGQAVVARGSVVVTRSRDQYRLVDLSGVQKGDEIATGSDGAASILLGPGTIVYLAPRTRIAIGGANSAPALELLAGEARLVAGAESNAQIILREPQGRVTVRSGIVRWQHTAASWRIAAQRGSTHLQLQNRSVVDLKAGQEARLANGNVSIAAAGSDQGWALDMRRFYSGSLAKEASSRSADATENPPPEAAERSAEEQADSMRRPPGASQTQISAASAAASSVGLAAAPGLSASAGLFADANQATLQGQLQGNPATPFPGNIHLVTAETRYAINDVKLSASERSAAFPGGLPSYYSIGIGAPPTTQISTDLQTGSNPIPHAIPVPGYNSYVVRLDQYGTIDSTLNPAAALSNNVGTTGFVGDKPSAPTITGATPLADNRAEINSQLTFALGEIRLRPDGGANGNSLELAIRTSDQDRKIIKDPGGDDSQDIVTPNSKVGAFQDVADPRFLPAAPLVKVPVPGTFSSQGTRFSQLDHARQAAVTVALADKLYDHSHRTGQTRFVVDGKIIDISGYRK